MTDRDLAGGTAERAVDGVSGTSNSITNIAVFFVANRRRDGGMAVEH